MKLSEFLKTLRETEKLSQRELARRCDLSHSLISLLEQDAVNRKTGKTMTPDIETYRKIANGAGITIHELFTIIDEDAEVRLSDPAEDQIILSAYHKADDGTKAAVRKLLDIK